MILRRKRVWIPILGTVLVLGIVVLGNQLVRSSAESRIAKTIACGLKTSRPTTAHLAGPWAALGVLDGDLGTVNIGAEQVPLGGTAVDLQATLYHVTTSGKTSGGNASATVGYDQIQQRLGSDLGANPQLAGDGRNLVINTTFGVPVTVYASLTVAPQAITVTPTQVSALDQKYSIPALMKSPFGRILPKDQLSPRTIPLPGLPTGTNVTAATPAANGLHLTLHLPPSIVAPTCTR